MDASGLSTDARGRIYRAIYMACCVDDGSVHRKELSVLEGLRKNLEIGQEQAVELQADPSAPTGDWSDDERRFLVKAISRIVASDGILTADETIYVERLGAVTGTDPKVLHKAVIDHLLPPM